MKPGTKKECAQDVENDNAIHKVGEPEVGSSTCVVSMSRQEHDDRIRTNPRVEVKTHNSAWSRVLRGGENIRSPPCQNTRRIRSAWIMIFQWANNIRALLRAIYVFGRGLVDRSHLARVSNIIP